MNDTLLGAAEVVPSAVHYPGHHGQGDVEHGEHPGGVTQGERVIHTRGGNVGN